MSTDPAITALKRVQQTIRSTAPVEPSDSVRSQRVPGTKGSDAKYVLFNTLGRAAVEKAADLLADDERFEHLKDATAAVWELATAVATDKTSDHVQAFVTRHGRTVESRRCFMLIDHLKTTEPWAIAAVEFLPIDHGSVPKPSGWFRQQDHSGTVAVTTVSGTHLGRMAERARSIIDNALRLLRLDLFASQMAVADEQLRFRTGEAYAFADEITGWRRSPDQAFELAATGEVANHLAAGPLGKLLSRQPGDLNESLRVAASWLERAIFTADPLVDVLFSFFALEALLGRKSDALKGDSLAVRQMTLDHELTGGFAHPNKLWQQYDQIRSVAVHGSGTPNIDARDARELRHGVTRTFEQVITLAHRESIKRKESLLRWLDNHRDLPRLADWLVQYGGSDWQQYFGAIAATAHDTDAAPE